MVLARVLSYLQLKTPLLPYTLASALTCSSFRDAVDGGFHCTAHALVEGGRVAEPPASSPRYGLLFALRFACSAATASEACLFDIFALAVKRSFSRSWQKPTPTLQQQHNVFL